MKQKVRMVIALVTLIFLNMVSTIAFTGADDETDTEVGIWWENYNGTEDQLNYTDEDARSFSDNLVDDGWTELFDRGNADSDEEPWVNSANNGSDNSWVDDCDFVYWTGHGQATLFHVEFPSIPIYNDWEIVEAEECTWGDDEGDLEWVFLNSCEALHANYVSDWDDAFAGLHGICGFHSLSLWDPTYRLGNATANYLVSQTCIGGSWKKATEWYFEEIDKGSVTAACYSALINRPGYSPFNYYYESTDGMWPDYGSGGITLSDIEYTDWNC